ncbi:MAG: PLP-dependent aminotransferase family protein [Chitinophagaceae bacterium]|nr:PLP-dependent aminotransferase family protein [Chitinophagaceae bacterium]
MLPFRTLIVINRTTVTPVYLQIANGLIKLIRDGVIQPGASLPGSRQLAALLDVHRKTVESAYEELSVQDWITVIPRKGVQVSQRLPEINPKDFNDSHADNKTYGSDASFPFFHFNPTPLPVKGGKFRPVINDGFPDPRIAPIDLLLREYRRLFNQSSYRRFIMTGDQAGSVNLRTAITQFLSETRGLNLTIDNILITRGAQMAIFMAARMIIRPGSTVLVGNPNYFMADAIFQQFGARLVRVPMDENGMDIGFIENFCNDQIPDLLYIVPHHHHPTTVTLSAERRMRLLQLIEHHPFPVIEDDYDYDFHYAGGPILPLASAGHKGNVIYIGSLTKSIAPPIRVGYMIAPANFIGQAAQLRRMIDVRGDSLLEEALAFLFREGDMQRHLKRSVKLYHQRRDILCRLLEQELGDVVSFIKPQGGLALWTKFREDYPLPLISARAANNGLMINDGRMYDVDDHRFNALRIGFASMNEKELEEAVFLLKQTVRSINA